MVLNYNRPLRLPTKGGWPPCTRPPCQPATRPGGKKPKNATVAIAQNARRSGSASGDLLISVRICLSTVTVMGIRMRGVPLFCVARALRMPSRTLFSTGSVDSSRGQGSPRDNCMLRTADRYTLIVWGARPSLAKLVAK